MHVLPSRTLNPMNPKFKDLSDALFSCGKGHETTCSRLRRLVWGGCRFRMTMQGEAPEVRERLWPSGLDMGARRVASLCSHRTADS